MQRFEALRLSIVTYHQWPGNNPWSVGGQPLLPTVVATTFSIDGVAVLLFGTFWGLRISAIAYLVVGYWGAWKVSRLFWPEPVLRLVFALYTITNAAIAYHLAVGHLAFENFWYIPWFLYFILRATDDGWSGVKAGVLFGLACVRAPAYVPQYAGLLFAGLLCWLWWKQRREHNRTFARWLMLFVPVLATIVFYRFSTMFYGLLDFPRISTWRGHLDSPSMLTVFFRPFTDLDRSLDNVTTLSIPIWEVACYLGVTSILLACLSLLKGVHWWHVMTVLLMWAFSGNDSMYYLMFWIQKIPSYSSLQTFTRVRLFIPLFLGIAATSGLSFLWSATSHRRLLRPLVLLLSFALVAEVMIVSHKILKTSHMPFVYAGGDNPDGLFRNISQLPRPSGIPGEVNLVYSATKMNLGWLRGYGDSNLPGNTIRVGLNDAGYIGEYFQGHRPVTPIYWSPNRLVFEHLDPSVALSLNMNPSKAWYANGRQLFPHYRIVEVDKAFDIMPDAQGRVDLEYRFPGQSIGVAGTAIFSVISLIMCFAVSRWPNRPNPAYLTQ
ncbi:MAG: hypothetical protein IT369_16150 [Candidatus Latescibacteria bacterium]|nr:hypothetical protein [Candidatus Latescibacterota bacterium]